MGNWRGLKLLGLIRELPFRVLGLDSIPGALKESFSSASP